MSKPAGKCPFCRCSGDLTHSHIWPEWIEKILPQSATHHEHQIGKFHTFKPKALVPELRHKIREGHVGKRKPRNTCRRCNGGWQRRIEEATMPFLGNLLLGNWFLLDTFSQRLLATFLCLVSMRVELSSRMRAIPESDRTWLQTHFEPPPDWKIWIARYEGPGRMDERYAALQIASSPDVLRGVEYVNTQVTTFVIGQLCAHLFSSTHWRTFRGYHDADLTQIWPARQFDVDMDLVGIITEPEVALLHEAIARETIEVPA